MRKRKIPTEVLSRMKRDRELIAQELPELIERNARMREAAAEATLSGRLRQAIHQSGRPLPKLPADAGISAIALCDFLEGERTLRSDVIDRLGLAVGASVSIATPT